MRNGERPAQPLNGDKWQKELGHGIMSYDYQGITKREYFAAMAMQGLCANSNPGSQHIPKNLIHESLEMADELLKQL